jgi:hypothetical protein
MPNLTSNNLAYSVIIKNSIFLKIMHDIFNFRDTEVYICIILVLLKKADSDKIQILID